MALRDEVENALNETRMLVLGTQVLIGFQFQATFMPVFQRLPQNVQVLQVGGLMLMLTSLALLLTPSAFHQIVERGNDSRRITNVTGRIAAIALLPFAFGIGVDVYIAGFVALQPSNAMAMAVAVTATALFFWYGIEWALRLSGRATRKNEVADSNDADLATRLKLVLTEARVVLPGAQALLGFQFAAMLTDAFGQLPNSSQYLHLACLGLIALAIVLLMAPAAFHRIVEHGQDTERMHTFSSIMVLAALVPIGFGVAGDFYVVADKVLPSHELAIGLAVGGLICSFGLWFGFALAVRMLSPTPGGQQPTAEPELTGAR